MQCRIKCRLISVLFALSVLSLPLPTSANLCEKSSITDRYRDEAKLIRGEDFVRGPVPSPDYIGDDEYNAWILACNRMRDNQGKEIDQKISAKTGGNFANDLPERSIKGQYSYYGNTVAANVFTSLEYRYRLRRSGGTWIVTLPIEFKLPGTVFGRNQQGQPVPILSNRIDIAQFLAVKLGLMSHDGKGNLECDQGKEKWRSAPRGVTPSKIVDTGFIGPAKDTYDGVACRLAMDRVVPGGKSLLKEYYDFWKRSIETAWNRIGFTVKIVVVGHDTIDDTLMKELKRDDQIWTIHTTLDPNQRPRYRSAFLSDPHFYTGAYSDTIAHEAGHELGLDDEYRENDKGGKNAWRDCAGDNSELPGANYLMCVSSSASVTDLAGMPRWWEPPFTIANPNWWTAPYTITNPESAKGIYPWIITRRYTVGLASQCFEDNDCNDNQYCDKGGVVGIGRNACVPKKKENDNCGSDHQCIAPAICKGKPLGRCATEAAVDLGDKCTKDFQCKTDSCNKDGRCQCTENSDCNGTDQFCDKGGFAGVGKNVCVRKKGENEQCGNDLQCKSPATCKSGRCVTEATVELRGKCTRDVQCKSGSCNSDGVCQCGADSDCTGTNQYCDKGGFAGVGKNTCLAKKTENGQCGNNSQCISPATCKSGRCITENSVSLGGSCSTNSQCKSGNCDNNGLCQCDQNSDCTGTNARCLKGTLGIGRNVCTSDSSKLDVGAQCLRNDQCSSGSCSGKGRCQCKKDSDCKIKGQQCKKPITKENWCE